MNYAVIFLIIIVFLIIITKKYCAEIEAGKKDYWPVEGHFVAQLLLMDVTVEEVVTDVGRGSLHEFDENFSFGHVKVVLQKLTRVWGFPEEVLGDVPPELCRTEYTYCYSPRVF